MGKPIHLLKLTNIKPPITSEHKFFYMIKTKIFFTGVIFLLGISLTRGHQNKPHTESLNPSLDSKAQLEAINQAYLKKIKPIFQMKCLDCHGTASSLPWYSKIPGPKGIIERDIREAHKHMDMDNDFPFGGHGSPQEDLYEIKEVVHDNSMPPFQYKLLHWRSGLTAEEKNKILNWIDESLAILDTEK